MKSFLIIGMGSLGNHLCDELSRNNCEIMIADINPAKVENANPAVVTARVCDCTNRNVLESLGVEDFDVCFVCIEDYFQACLEITDLLKELGAKKIYSTADDVAINTFIVNCTDGTVLSNEGATGSYNWESFSEYRKYAESQLSDLSDDKYWLYGPDGLLTDFMPWEEDGE